MVTHNSSDTFLYKKKFFNFYFQELLLNNIFRALELGHVDTAQFLMRLSRQDSPPPSVVVGATHSPPSAAQSRGFTELHELVLYTEDPLPAAFTVSALQQTS